MFKKILEFDIEIYRDKTIQSFIFDHFIIQRFIPDVDNKIFENVNY